MELLYAEEIAPLNISDPTEVGGLSRVNRTDYFIFYAQHQKSNSVHFHCIEVVEEVSEEALSAWSDTTRSKRKRNILYG